MTSGENYPTEWHDLNVLNGIEVRQHSSDHYELRSPYANTVIEHGAFNAYREHISLFDNWAYPTFGNLAQINNPNPQLITDAAWELWLVASTAIPGVQLSGIYANKPGYHNTVNANLKNWPGNYSVRLSLDIVPNNRNKARAIDLTMSDKEMVKWTSRMKASAEDPNDPRLQAVKEFYGTLDNKTVFGLSHNSATGSWRRVTSDDSHLWHGHTSIFTAFINDWSMLEPLISVWRGETLAEWKGNLAVGLPRKGDKNEDVHFWQSLHNAVRNTVTPASPVLTVDSDYGDATQAAFKDFWSKQKGVSGKYDGTYLSGWVALKYEQALIQVSAPIPEIDDDKLKALIADWLQKNVVGDLKIQGTFTGKVVP